MSSQVVKLLKQMSLQRRMIREHAEWQRNVVRIMAEANSDKLKRSERRALREGRHNRGYPQS